MNQSNGLLFRMGHTPPRGSQPLVSLTARSAALILATKSIGSTVALNYTSMLTNFWINGTSKTYLVFVKNFI